MIRSSLQNSLYDAGAGSGLAVRVALSHGYTASPMIIPAAKIFHPQSDRNDAYYFFSPPKSRLTAAPTPSTTPPAPSTRRSLAAA
jgi:hypothetical protein